MRRILHLCRGTKGTDASQIQFKMSRLLVPDQCSIWRHLALFEFILFLIILKNFCFSHFMVWLNRLITSGKLGCV
uniref:Uncharacterized protein n=1 Tax=Populus trichocarpa TaxID=3694 RepID=A9P9K2_POPTR|nr:unknown [Populus trichocarpa]